MGIKGCCRFCGGVLNSVSIGWKCEDCGALLDMQSKWHEPVNELFIPDDVLKENEEIKGEKYRRAIERMGQFGKPFVEYDGDQIGPMGRAGNVRIEEEAKLMPVIEDVDGGKWRPVQEEVLQEVLKRTGLEKDEKEELAKTLEKVEQERDAAIRELRKFDWCCGCKHFLGLGGCAVCTLGICGEMNDMYEFRSEE